MYIAISKRKENIAEYVLYLWQLEDILRALQFSPEAIYSQLVRPHQLAVEQENQLLGWYMDIVNLLRGEGKESVGHIEHTLHLISDLQELHEQLLVLPVGAKYREQFALLQPELPQLKKMVGRDAVGDIELCFRALYAVVLYRIKGDKGAEKAIADVIELVSPVMAELAAMHRKVEAGDINLFEQGK